MSNPSLGLTSALSSIQSHRLTTLCGERRPFYLSVCHVASTSSPLCYDSRQNSDFLSIHLLNMLLLLSFQPSQPLLPSSLRTFLPPTPATCFSVPVLRWENLKPFLTSPCWQATLCITALGNLVKYFQSWLEAVYAGKKKRSLKHHIDVYQHVMRHFRRRTVLLTQEFSCRSNTTHPHWALTGVFKNVMVPRLASSSPLRECPAQ